jgi:GTP cyclohydrolase IIa
LIQVGVIQLVNYESWIKSLGFDREWIVQATQSEIYRRIVIKSAELELFSIPLTYDNYLVINNAAGVSRFRELLKALEPIDGIRIAAYLGRGNTYLDALNNVVPFTEDGSELEDSKDIESTVVVHIDVDGYLKVVHREGLGVAISVIDSIAYNVKRMCMKFGGVAFYAGGDNVMCFIPQSSLEMFVKHFDVKGVKVGIGIAKRPRYAVKLATQALEMIREGRCERICILGEDL